MPFSPHSCKSYAARAVRNVLYAVLTDARRPNVAAAFASAGPIGLNELQPFVGELWRDRRQHRLDRPRALHLRMVVMALKNGQQIEQPSDDALELR